MKAFKTVREAAIAALHEVLPLSKLTGFEYGGLILSSKSGYTYTKAITDGDTGSVTIDKEDIQIPAGSKAVSDYHTHPCRTILGKEMGYFDKYFSTNDVHSSLQYSGFKTAYMAPTCSGTVYESNLDLPVVWPDGDEGPPAALGPVVGKA